MEEGRDYPQEYKNVALKIADEINKAQKEIIGICISGSIASGYSDKYSDIDLDIWLTEKDYKLWTDNCPLMERFAKYSIKRETPSNYSFGINADHKIDIALLSIDRVRNEEWRIEQKANRSKSIIIFDTKNIVRSLLDDKLHHKEEDFIVKEYRSATIPNTDYFSFYISAALNYFVPLSLGRNKIEQAHFNLNWAIDFILNLVWVEKHQFYPYEKAKWDIVNESFDETEKVLIKEAQLIKEYTAEDVKRRRGLLRELYKKLGYEETTFYHGKIDLS